MSFTDACPTGAATARVSDFGVSTRTWLRLLTTCGHGGPLNCHCQYFTEFGSLLLYYRQLFRRSASVYLRGSVQELRHVLMFINRRAPVIVSA
jgi:hypothetical protein